MTTLSIFTGIRKAIAEHGLLNIVLQAPSMAYHRIFPRKPPTHPFDLQHGVETSGLHYQWQLPSNHDSARHVTAYWGTHPSLFEKIISRWKQTVAIPVESYHFIDIGCGKGRALLMASETPFASITGIDLHQTLTDVARSNIHHWLQKPRACQDIRVLTEDALTLELPEGPAVVYMYYPFYKEITRPFMAHLRKLASMRRDPIDLIYVNPTNLNGVDFNTGLKKLVDEKHAFSPEEITVDAFHSTSHRYQVYRFTDLPGTNHAAG